MITNPIKQEDMKTLLKNMAIAFTGITLFSFTAEQPKTVIVDIVDNIESTTDQNLTKQFKESINSLNASQEVKVLDWKEISNGLDDAKKQRLLDSIQPEVVLTVNFKNAKKDENTVTAVVSKKSNHLEHSTIVARDLTASFDQAKIKNEGVYQTESDYVQDNAKPAVFVSIETKNDQPSNDVIVNTLTDFIKKVHVEKSTNDIPKMTPNDSISVQTPQTSEVQIQ